MTTGILLNGWSVSANCWSAALSQTSDRFDWQVWDLHDFPSWEALQKALDEQLSPGDVLAGWSQGGMLALRYAAHATHRLKGLVTLNANLRFVRSDRAPEALSEQAFSDFRNVVESHDAEHIVRHFSALILKGGGDRSDRHALKSLYSADRLPDRSTLLHLLSCLGGIDNAKIDATGLPPTLHVLGSHDALVPGACSQRLSEVTGGKVHVYSGGHIPFLSAWPNVSDAIANFLGALNHA